MRLLKVIGLLIYFEFSQCDRRWDVFSTKTLYEWANDVQMPVRNKHNELNVDGTLCKAIHVNMVVRHGARNPTLKNMKYIKALHEKIVKAKDPTAFPELDNWKFRYDTDREGELVSKGITEQNDLGARTGARFHHLFDKNGKYVKFVSSRKSRTKDSARHFHGGLSEYMTNKIPSFDNEVNNATMRFYDGCYNYEHQVEDNVTQFEQFHKFSKTPQFINIAKSLKSKLKAPFSFTEDDVYQIYELCAYESYIFNDNMTWCKLLTDEDRILLEYGQDIEKYYKLSYGHPINSQMACPLVKDMFDTMDKAMNSSWDYENLGDMNNTDYLAAKFQFGHSETIVPLMTALGLYKDNTPLLATNFNTMSGRKFRTSNIDPYTSNLAFVIYACDNVMQTYATERGSREFVVKLFVNAKEVNIPSCGDLPCYYGVVKRKYNDYINKCNIKEICGIRPDDNVDSQGNIASTLSVYSITGQLLTILLFLLPFI
ncbi:multiple inositol polyphosphate phosphatase 1-like [Ruditapes philippinarum]|uniref:multiple inositol polyphosphate phosphatase 1-like n=1 Tax=Ruditapes philippinarum TaxID=129788 RepID=UPI00295B1D08|nr:multiple inositol polyphosphate phosphatase 1-like [Ruditapes philippinarum]